MSHVVRFLYFRYTKSSLEFAEIAKENFNIASINIPEKAIGFCIQGAGHNYYLIDEQVKVMAAQEYIDQFMDTGYAIRAKNNDKTNYPKVLTGPQPYDVLRLTEKYTLLDRETRKVVPHLA